MTTRFIAAEKEKVAGNFARHSRHHSTSESANAFFAKDLPTERQRRAITTMKRSVGYQSTRRPDGSERPRPVYQLATRLTVVGLDQGSSS